MIIELLGRHGEVLKRVSLPPLCKSVSIREDHAVDRDMHSPNRVSASNWDEQRNLAGMAAVAR